ncbi:arf-GAP domain and FG repeat-containing protein 2 isoform X2 [Latimeria chalumnae]|uniref:arf-GAP domain and FG repeat-containing protein 2 isoform X2 n=1 Tax=Latimeria chalumnae TaxID=7897 RepID=UPI00313CB99D
MSLSKRQKDLDEVLSKRVRELGGSPANRHCFECEQRGVTYIDITVGTFICTSCSGILRGLNPPHRVKSISMTTFTEQEVEFLQAHGNEVCRKTWLGLFDSRATVIPDSRDPQKLKEFLQEKYEKKRWYVSPNEVKSMSASSTSTSVLGSVSTPPEVKPLRTLLGESVPSLSVSRPAPNQGVSQPHLQLHRAQPVRQLPLTIAGRKSNTDLLADIGGDPFAASQPAQNFATFPAFGAPRSAVVTTGFANFDAFGSSRNAFGGVVTTSQTPFQPQSVPAGGTAAAAGSGNFASFPKSSSAGFGGFAPSQNAPAAAGQSGVPPANKYAPLADLESVFITTKAVSGGSSQVTGFGGTSSVPAGQSGGISELNNIFGVGAVGSVATGSVFGTVSQAPTLPPASSNPPAFGAFTNPFAVTSAHHPPVSPTNPFKTNGAAAGSVFGMGVAASSGFGAAPPAPAPGGFAAPFQPQQPFLQQTLFPQQQSDSSFGAFPVPRTLGQTSGVSTNPFVTGGTSAPFAAGSSSTNPFL